MPQNRDIEPISKQLTIVIGLTVVGFMAFGLALSFYRNILFEKTLEDLQAENNKIADKIQQGYTDLEYYQSTQYKDKFAKENLNRITRGEKMMIINTPAPDPLLATDNTAEDMERRQAAYTELLSQMPVIEHWKLYLFHRDRIADLESALVNGAVKR